MAPVASVSHVDGNWLARCYYSGVGEIRRTKRTKQMSDFAADQMLALQFEREEQALKPESSFSTFHITFSDGTDQTCFSLEECIQMQIEALAEDLRFTVVQSPAEDDQRAITF